MQAKVTLTKIKHQCEKVDMLTKVEGVGEHGKFYRRRSHGVHRHQNVVYGFMLCVAVPLILKLTVLFTSSVLESESSGE